MRDHAVEFNGFALCHFSVNLDPPSFRDHLNHGFQAGNVSRPLESGAHGLSARTEILFVELHDLQTGLLIDQHGAVRYVRDNNFFKRYPE